MAIALGNTLLQLKKGGILAPAVFANLKERREEKVRKGLRGRTAMFGFTDMILEGH